MANFSWPRFSLVSALLASASFAGVEGAHAQDNITTAITTPVATATASNGKAPADIVITSTGTITLSSGSTASAAVLLNSSNNVTNQGTITIDSVNNVSGILVNGGNTGNVNNSGSISVTDSTPETSLGANLSLTAGTSRYGILIEGTSPVIGSITEGAGTISVLGNNSAAIAILGPTLEGSGTTYSGGILLAGTTSLTGVDGYGLQVMGAVTGISNAVSGFSAGISVTGGLSAFGTGSSAIAIGAPVTSGLYIDGNVQSNAYYNGAQDTSRPAFLPTGFSTKRNELQAGPGIIVGANIGGGIELDNSAVVTTLGSAPALLIGAQSGGTTTISAGPSTYGILINPSAIVTANGIYDGIGTTTIQIGGALISNSNSNPLVITNGPTTIAGGIDNQGKIRSLSYAADATTLSFQTGATATSLTNAGTISADIRGGYNGTTGATAVNATAISDTAGALTSITNTGTIIATAAPSGMAKVVNTTTALDSTATGLVLTQSASGTATAPSIVGDIYFGTSATLNLEAGTITGAVSYGAGDNALTLTNNSQLSSAITQASGGTLALAVDSGHLVDTSLQNLSLSSLTIGKSGEIDFAVDPATGQSGGGAVVGAVVISSGAKIGLDFESKLFSPETFTVVTSSAGALMGQPSLLLGDVPYFYMASLTTNADAGTISANISDRSFAAAGVPGNAAAYKAIFGAFDRDPGVFDTFNSASTQRLFRDVYQQVLPSYSGGLFEMLSEGAGALVEAQANNPIVQRGDRSGAWAQQIGFGVNQNSSEAPGYYGGGLGFAFGWEDPVTPISTLGYSVAYMRGSVTDENAGPDNQEVGTVYMAGVYWRETDGNLHVNASLNAGIAELNSNRNFAGAYFEGTGFTRNASSHWNGGVGQAHVGLDYEQDLGDDFFIRPSIAGDYFILYQGGHSDRNGGSSLDLNYASGVGKQGSATGALTIGTRVGEGFIWRPELTVGYEDVFGGPDSTTADFVSGGSAFTLSAPNQKSGAIAKIGVHGGDKYTDIAFEAGGEDRGDYRAITGQLVARFNF